MFSSFDAFGELDSDYLEDDSKPIGSKSFPNTHLQAAMRDDIVRFACNEPVDNPGRFAHVVKERDHLNTMYPNLFDQPSANILDHTKVVAQWFIDGDFISVNESFPLDRWQCEARAALHNINIQVLGLTSTFVTANWCELTDPPWVLNKKVAMLKCAREQLDVAVCNSARQRMVYQSKTRDLTTSQLPVSTTLPGGLSLTHTANFVVLSYKDAVTVGPRDLLLMFADIVSERYLLYVASVLATVIQEPQYLTPSVLDSVLSWGDLALVKCGLSGYELLKEFEPLVMSCLLLSKPDPYGDGAEFRAAILDSLEAKQQLFRPRASQLLSLVDGIRNPHLISQIFGLYRLWGHPYVDAVDGLLKMKHLGLQRKLIPVKLRHELTCKFKEHLCVHYRAKRGKWPNLDVSQLEDGNYLKDIILSNRVLDLSKLDYDFNDWRYVSGLPTFEVDSSFNLAAMLSDKALSLSRRELKEHIETKKNIGTASERRVITHWLQSDQVSARDLLMEVSARGLPKSDLAIGITPKEREMKTCPRMFSLMTLPMRMFVVAVGELLATHIVPLFPEITVGDSALQLSRRLYEITRPQASKRSGGKGTVEVVMNVDFSKWNTNIRRELTEGCFKFIDELLGFEQCVSYIAPMFEQSLIYLADGSHLPVLDDNLDVHNDPLAWTGHLGGLEGLNQKGWTAVTVALIRMVAERHNVLFKLVGQGDNQVMRLTFPVTYLPDGTINMREVKHRIQAFKADFIQFMESAGLPVKISETWISSLIFAYGKMLYMLAMPLAMSCKRICRMFWLSNDLFPSLENTMSTITSNAISACQSDLTVIIPFCVSVFEYMYALLFYSEHTPFSGLGLDECITRQKFKWSVMLSSKMLSKDYRVTRSVLDLVMPVFRDYIRNPRLRNHWELLAALALVPKCLGGYSSHMLICFLVRGFPDPLSEALSGLKLIIQFTPSSKIAESLRAVGSPEMCPEASSRMLIQDPLSVNLLVPSSAAGTLKYAVRKFLAQPGVITNTFFKRFFEEVETDTDLICDALVQTAPLWPRLLHDIFDASLPGYANSVVGRIIKTTTIVSQAVRRDGQAVEKRMYKSDIQYYASVVFRLNSSGPDWICSFAKAIELRNKGWAAFGEIKGVTTPHPVEFLSGCELPLGACPSCDKSGPDYLLLYLHQPEMKGSCVYEPWNVIGPSEPYIGSMTEEKTQQPKYSSYEDVDPLIKRAANVLRAVNWIVKHDDPLARFMVNVFKSLTDVDPDSFFSVEDSFSGSAEHRFKDYSTFHGGLLSTLYCYETYMHVSSNNWRVCSRGGQNKNVHFQAVYCCMQTATALTAMSFLTRECTSLHFHLSTACCVQDIDEPNITGDPKLSAIQLKQYTDSEYCFISKEKMVEKKTCVIRQPPTLLYEGLSNKDKSLLLASIMAHELVSHVFRELRESKTTVSGRKPPLLTAWAKDGDPVELLEQVSLYLASSVVRYRRQDIRTRTLKDFDDLISAAISYLASYPPRIFSVLGFLFLFPESRLTLASSKFAIQLPASFPLRNDELAECCKLAVTTVLGNLDKVGNYNLMCINNLATNQHEWMLNQLFAVIVRQGFADELWETWDEIDVLFNKADVTEGGQSVFSLIDSLLTVDLSMSKWLSGKQKLKAVNNWGFLKAHVEIVEMNMTGDRASKERNQLPYIRPGQHLRLRSISKKVKVRLSVWAIPDPKISDDNEDICLANLTVVPDPVEFKTHFYRPLYLITSAHYKYYRILLNSLRLVSNRATIVICGDGTGGVTALVKRLRPDVKVYFNSLVELTNVAAQSLTTFTPPALDLLGEGAVSELWLRRSIEGISDITDPRFCDQVGSLLKEERVEAIICDAEGSGWNSPLKGLLLIKSLLKTSLMFATCKQLIFKTYATDGASLAIQCVMIKSVYSQACLIRSPFTSENSSEMFLVGMMQRADAQIYELSATSDPLIFYGRVPSPTFIQVVADQAERLKRVPTVTKSESDKVSEALACSVLISHNLNHLDASLRFCSRTTIRDTESTHLNKLFWRPLHSRLKSRLSAARDRAGATVLETGHAVARDVFLQLMVVLMKTIDAEHLATVIVPYLLQHTSVCFYATKNHRTSAILVLNDDKPAVKPLAEKITTDRSQSYLVRLESAFTRAQYKRLFSLLGRFRYFEPFNGAQIPDQIRFEQIAEANLRKEANRDNAVLLSVLTEEFRRSETTVVIKIPPFCEPIATAFMSVYGPRMTIKWTGS
ncbi:RNA-dependent RNA polymerase [Shayang ascaridia galli virus 2]|uniref:RNA-directed RNA polymerase L n=1 Tax=Shayang ascaridia galli virus 2 TaxID=1923460 RepID=A0A1L3KN15_9RHAB|nr:RNA-dependent RNA polymerase [Shayang ascaridia galli virus 2]APG78777.1 RNA-dependent RNA polymerase [Shayang ascaridia galli virus 2]